MQIREFMTLIYVITKEKYQRLMDEKIQIERERNKLFTVSQKLIKIIQDSGMEVDLSEFRGIRSQAGISLLPGDGDKTELDYGPFRNDF